MTLFLDEADFQLARAAAAAGGGDAAALAQCAHFMKSSAANLGAAALAACYRELEQCAREARLDDARVLLEQTRREQAQALAALRLLIAAV